MAIKTVKCADCQKVIPQTEAYKVTTTSKAGINKNTYYCSKEIYDDIEREKKYNQQFKDFVISNLLGHGREEKAWSILLNKQMGLLHDGEGYTYSKMYYCVLKNERYITSKIEKIKTEASKITYLMAIVKGGLEDEAHITKMDEIFTVDIDLLNKLETDYKIVNNNKNILDFLN